MREQRADILIVGGGTGGCAAALGASSLGYRVILTEETDWIGGQLTAQAVPPDEHPWIERFGCTRRYRQLREGVRHYYRDHYPLTPEARSEVQPQPRQGLGVAPVPRTARRAGGAGRDAGLPAQPGQLEVLLHRKPVERRRGRRYGKSGAAAEYRYRRRGRHLGQVHPGCHRAGRPAASGRRRVRERGRVAGADRRAARRPRPGPAARRAVLHLVLPDGL